jgi:hypothetical protein
MHVFLLNFSEIFSEIFTIVVKYNWDCRGCALVIAVAKFLKNIPQFLPAMWGQWVFTLRLIGRLTIHSIRDRFASDVTIKLMKEILAQCVHYEGH